MQKQEQILLSSMLFISRSNISTDVDSNTPLPLIVNQGYWPTTDFSLK